MIKFRIIKAKRISTHRFLRDDDGATLVELAIVLPVFLLLFFGLIDFGRLGFNLVMAEKATQMAARIAAVRPPACAGVPLTQTGTGATPSGAFCRNGGCASVAPVTCAGAAGDATVNEIWARVGPLMPSNATEANLLFSYTQDQRLGFVSGPYVPMVTVEIQNLTFEFVSPLGALAALAGAIDTDGLGAAMTFPSMSVSLPGEDLALGSAG